MEQVADYYAFGLQQNSNSFQKQSTTKNPLLYNGKEIQDELIIGWLDYGMRMYQPEVSRFSTIDRFSDKYLDLSPYQYAANNPVNFIDINGDSLDVGGNKQESFDALMSFVPKKFRDRFSLDEESGKVSFNKDGLKTKKNGDLRNSTLGFMDAVVNDNEVNILFETGETTTVQEGYADVESNCDETGFSVGFNKQADRPIDNLTFPDHSFSNFISLGKKV